MRTDTSLDVKELLEENIRLSKAILASSERTRKHMHWSEIISVLRLLIILVPIILAILYIPPFLVKFSDSFSRLYGGEQFNILEYLKGGNTGSSELEQIKNFLNKQIK
ncbi:MAG: hypothetical protein WC459_00075 [Patescibacteria group bacterium]